MDEKISKGDFIAITYNGEPFYGRVQSASNYGLSPEKPNWYIEMKSPDGPHYWKQDSDGGGVHVIAANQEDCLLETVLQSIYDEYRQVIVDETWRRVLAGGRVTKANFTDWSNDGSSDYNLPEINDRIFAVYRQVQHEVYENHMAAMLVMVRARLYMVDV